MELTARDIHEKQFHDAWRGYNQEEVDDFLDRVAESFDLIQRENTAVLGRVRELEQALSTSRETEEMLKKTLVSAQQAAEEAIAKAQQKADALLAEAQERSARANEEARQRLASVDAELRRKALDADREHTVRKRELDAAIERLRGFESDLKRRLTAFLEQQVRSLETLTEAPPPGSGAEQAAARRSPTPPEPGNGARDTADSGRGRAPADQEGGRDEEREQDEALRLDEGEEVGAPHRRGVRSLFLRDEG
jgi:cell division initiation protein